MRTLLCLAAALSLTFTIATPTPTAEACGGYGGMIERAPQVLETTTHFVRGPQTGRRTFVLLGSPAPDGLAWKALVPSSYDYTQIAPAPEGPARTFTVVSPRGARVVTSARYLYVKDTFRMGAASLAVEIEPLAHNERAFALHGEPRAVWQPVATKARTAADVAWLQRRGMLASDARTATLMHAGELDLVTVHDRANQRTLTFVRGGKHDGAAHEGRVEAVLVVGGSRYVAIRNVNVTRLVEA